MTHQYTNKNGTVSIPCVELQQRLNDAWKAYMRVGQYIYPELGTARLEVEFSSSGTLRVGYHDVSGKVKTRVERILVRDAEVTSNFGLRYSVDEIDECVLLFRSHQPTDEFGVIELIQGLNRMCNTLRPIYLQLSALEKMIQAVASQARVKEFDTCAAVHKWVDGSFERLKTLADKNDANIFQIAYRSVNGK